MALPIPRVPPVTRHMCSLSGFMESSIDRVVGAAAVSGDWLPTLGGTLPGTSTWGGTLKVQVDSPPLRQPLDSPANRPYPILPRFAALPISERI